MKNETQEPRNESHSQYGGVMTVKKLILMSFMLVLTSFSYAHAETIQHYEAKEIKSVEEANTFISQSRAEIDEMLKSQTLSGAQHEQIHEISYTLEAAVDKLIKEKAGSGQALHKLDEAIQAVHFASENHEEAEVRKWVSAIKPASGETGDATQQADDGVYEIFIKDHKFTPEEIRAPAGKKLKLIVHNQDPTPEEFESDDFRREKIIAGNSKATIHVGPLKPGKYHYFGEFNLDSANGYLIVE